MQTFGLTELGTFTLYDADKVSWEFGTIEDAPKKPELPADMWITDPIDTEKAWQELQRLCRGC